MTLQGTHPDRLQFCYRRLLLLLIIFRNYCLDWRKEYYSNHP